MYGKIKFNLLFAAVGFIITFFFSFSHNLLTTSLIRGVIAFVLWFLLAFAVRWMWGLVGMGPSSGEPPEGEQGNGEVGNLVDLTTPDETEALNDMLKHADKQQEVASESGSLAFEPLNPPRLVKTTDRSTEEIVKAVRHLTEE